MAIYDLDTNVLAAQLTPSKKRLARYLAWHKVLLKPLQYLRDMLFGTYANGNTAADWDVLLAYSVGDQVKYTDKAVYQCWVATTAGILPTDADYWFRVQDNFVGAIPRAKYNAQRIVFEWALNEWFGTTFSQPPSVSDIYISDTGNSLDDFVVGVNESESSSAVYQNGDAVSFVQAQNPTYSQPQFTINIPVAVWTALGATNDDRDNVVRNIADLYVYAGITYTITTY